MSKSIKLSIAAKYSSKRINIDEISLDDFISTDNLLQNKRGKENATKLPSLKGLMPGYCNENILVGNIRPYLRKIWFADKESGCSADVLVFEVNKFYHPKFIYYTLFRDDFFEHMMKGSKGTKMPRGDKKQILDFLIPDFDFEEQKKIAKVLSDLDAKIELNNRINSELEVMAKTLYDYWFVQFDFPYVTSIGVEKPYKSSGGKMVWNEELKREIPEGWEVKPLNKVIETILDHRGKTPKKLGGDWTDDENGIIALSAKIVKGGKLNNLKQANKVSKELYEKWMPTKLVDGDILMTSEAPAGEFYFIQGKTDYCMSQRLFGIRANQLKIVPSYLYYELSKGNGYSQIMGSLSGSTVFGIRQDVLKKILVVVPALEKQREFNKIVLPQLKQIKQMDEQNQELASLRDWLLPMLMNGQVRVAEVAEELGMVAEPRESYQKKLEKTDENLKKVKGSPIKLNPFDVYKRTLLAAEIVFQLKDTLTLGHLKLQKMLYLCQEIENMALPMNFLKQAMGPYDNQLARSLDKQFEAKKWFKYQREASLKYKPLEKCGQHRYDFEKYFENELEGINYLINKFSKFTSIQIEAVATLYACWKEAIEKNELVNEKLIITKFYNWSKEKEKFKEENLFKALDWMRSNGVKPNSAIL